MNWIAEYKVEKTDNEVVIRGVFSATAGEFEIVQKGDGGNADTTEVTLSGGQYDTALGKPFKFTITGAWEIREVTEMFKLLDNAG